MTTVHVHASRDYDVLIGAGCLDSLGQHAAAIKTPCSALLVSDETVYALYGPAAEASLARAGFAVRSFVFAPGETSKTLATLNAILDALADVPCTRGDLVVALGGGVAGDMAGFAAAVYLRGIESVSYTHLDVYKRQPQRRRARVDDRPVRAPVQPPAAGDRRRFGGPLRRVADRFFPQPSGAG